LVNILQVVKEDLAFLQETFDEGAPPSRIRQESGTLRRLLLDGGGALQKATRNASWATRCRVLSVIAFPDATV
jgi:hypothetical protein